MKTIPPEMDYINNKLIHRNKVFKETRKKDVQIAVTKSSKKSDRTWLEHGRKYVRYHW